MSTFFEAYLGALIVDADLHQPVVQVNNLLKLLTMKELKGNSIERAVTLSGARNAAENYAEARAKRRLATRGSRLNGLQWNVPAGRIEDDIPVPCRDIKLAKDPAAGAEAIRSHVETGLEAFGETVGERFGGVAGGSIGLGTYSTTGHVVTFTDPAMAANFSPGMVLEISEDDGTDGAHTKVGSSAAVVSVDVDAGTIVVGTTSDDTTAANPGSWVNSTSYYFWQDGMFQPGSPTATMLGVSDVLPIAAATTTLAGLVRSSDSRLSGVRLSTTEAGTLTLLRRISKTCSKGQNTSGWRQGRKRYATVNPMAFEVIAGEVASQWQTQQAEDAAYGYSYIMVHTACGPVKVVSEPTCPLGFGRIIDADGIEMYTPNKKMVDFEGIGPEGMYRAQLADDENSYIIRPVLYNCTVWNNPAHHGVFPTGLS
jgi:hypothetical protein